MNARKIKIISAVVVLLTVSISCSLFVSTPHPQESTEEPYFGPTGGPLKFSPETLPDAQLGSAYEEKIQITLNNTPVGDFFISEGNLPEGLEFTFLEGEDAATISGTPSEEGEFTFTVGAWCFGTQVSGQMGEKTYTLTINP